LEMPSQQPPPLAASTSTAASSIPRPSTTIPGPSREQRSRSHVGASSSQQPDPPDPYPLPLPEAAMRPSTATLRPRSAWISGAPAMGSGSGGGSRPSSGVPVRRVSMLALERVRRSSRGPETDLENSKPLPSSSSQQQQQQQGRQMQRRNTMHGPPPSRQPSLRRVSSVSIAAAQGVTHSEASRCVRHEHGPSGNAVGRRWERGLGLSFRQCLPCKGLVRT
jgi:hypothetical protein